MSAKFQESWGNWGTHFFTRFGIEEYPAKLNYLRRVLGHVDAVFIAGCSYVDDDVAVEVWGLGTLSRHGDGEGEGEGEGCNGSVVSDCGWLYECQREPSGSRRVARGASTRKEMGLGRRKVLDVSEVGSWQLQLPGLECQ